MISLKNILTAVFIISIFALHPSLNKGKSPITYLHYFVYGNDLHISYNSSIDKEKVFIKWACEDESIDCNELVIFENGKQINNIPFEKGKQKLVVYYNNTLIGSLNQNKAAKTHAHQYNIQLKAIADILTFNGEIIGPASSKISGSVSIAELILAKR